MKYVMVRDYLTGLLEDGLDVGQVIPSERELTERFGVSRMTVRQAVDSLVGDGLLERRQGSGTYVAQPKVDLQPRITSFTEEMRNRGMIPSTEVITAERTDATGPVAAALDVPKGAPVFYLERVRLADGSPMALEHSWIAVETAPDLLEHGCPPSLYGALRDHGHGPTWGEDRIEAVALARGTADRLEVDAGAPALRIMRRTFAEDDAVSYAESYYRADRYTLWVPISSPQRTLYPPRVRRGGTA